MTEEKTAELNETPETKEIYCGYVRVSTRGQDYNSQLSIIQRFAEYKKLTIGKVYSEKISGANARRPQYAAMLAALRKYEFAGVIVFRLDRLGRNARELSMNVAELEDKGIKILSATESYDTSTAVGRAMREIIFIMAGLEREQIGEATKARLASAREAGKHIGRENAASRRQVKKVRELRSQGLGLKAIERQTQLSYGTIHAIVNNRGVYAPRIKAKQFEVYQHQANVDEVKTFDK